MRLEKTDLNLRRHRVRLVALSLLGMAVISATALLLETLDRSDHPKLRYHWKRHSIPPGMLVRGFFFYNKHTNGPEGHGLGPSG